MVKERDLPDIVQGDDETFDVTFKDDAENPIDISNWTVYVTVKADIDDPDSEAVITKDITAHDDAADGETSFKFTSSETDPLSGRHAYDIQVKKGNGDVKTLIKGSVKFVKDVTERTA